MTIPITVEVALPDPVEVTVDRTEAPSFTVEIPQAPVIHVDVGDRAGPRGPASTGTATYGFSNAATWTVTHSLGRIPVVQLVDTLGVQFDGDVEFPDLNTAVITHAAPKSGFALVS